MGVWDDEDEDVYLGCMCRMCYGLCCERCGADDDVQFFEGRDACPACRRDIEDEMRYAGDDGP